MKTCGSCKHWQPFDAGRVGGCMKIPDADVFLNDEPARIWKFGGTLEAKLITRPEFGCTLWEATE